MCTERPSTGTAAIFLPLTLFDTCSAALGKGKWARIQAQKIVAPVVYSLSSSLGESQFGLFQEIR